MFNNYLPHNIVPNTHKALNSYLPHNMVPKKNVQLEEKEVQLADGDGFYDQFLPSRLVDELAAYSDTKEDEVDSDSEDEDDDNSMEFCEFHGVRQLKYPNAPPNAPTRIVLKEHTVYNILKKDCVKCKEEKLLKKKIKKRKRSKKPNIVTRYKNGHPRIAPLHDSGKYQFLVYY